jgi:hypothetical protein
MARGKDSHVKLALPEVQALINAIIDSFTSGSAKSDEQKKALANAGQKLRALEKKLQQRK